MKDKKIADILGLNQPFELPEEKKKEEKQDLIPIENKEIEILDDNETLPSTVSVENSEIINDIDFAKKNVKQIINVGSKSLNDLIDLADSSESARAYEVAATIMKTMLDANKDYVDLSMKKKYAKEEIAQPTQNNNITNNNLIISTADLLKMLKGDTNE